MIWRVIPLEDRDAATNMATDDAIMESAANGGQPTIRFYRWRPSAVSIGFFQNLDRVDLNKCKDLGIDVVRRQTGGKTIHHNGDISYTLIAPESLFPGDIAKSHRVLCGHVSDSLKILGIEAELKLNDVMVDGKAISFNSRTRRNGVLMHHGTIFYNNAPKDAVKLLDFGNFDMQTVYHALVKGFMSNREFIFGHKTDEETRKMRELIVKYSSDEWLARR